MTATPRIAREQATALLATPTAAVVLELATGTVALDANPTDAVWEGATHVVLATHADALAAAAEAAGHADFLGRLTRILTLDVHARLAELPTQAELEAAAAELAAFEAEQAGGAA